MRRFSLRAFPSRAYPIVAACQLPQLVWLFIVCYAVGSALAETPPITPSGLNTQINLSSTPPAGHVQYDITGGTRPGGGTNLFHSFGDFNVPNHNIANFLNDSGLATSNILGRVTGGNISNIFGTIQTTGFGTANLFLMNPTGFLFGPNATVNVGGMVAFTSADYLRLANGILFNAIPNATADALVSAAPVAAFGFLGSNPGAITVQGSQLSVTPGQSISLVGGNISVQSGVLDDGTTVQPAGLSAPGGQINLASVASPGEILAETLAQAPNINGQSFGNLGTIQVSEQSVIDVSGNGGGTVLIRSGQFVLDNSTISANITGPGPVINGVESTGGGIDIQVSQKALIQNGALIDTSVTGNATPGVTYGGVHMKADQIGVQGIVDLDTGNFVTTNVQSTVAPGSTGGNSGDLKLEANSILVKDLGQVHTDTGGAGDAGNVFVTANQSLVVDVGIIGSLSLLASGNAGNIELTSTHGNILITNGSIVDTEAVRSSGNAGTITVNAHEGDVVLSGNDIFGGAAIFTLASRGTGAIGGIQITGKNLQLLNGSSIEADNFFSVNPVKPGSLNVSLSGSLSLDGGSFITTIGRGPASAADLNITAHDVNIAGGSFLTADTVGSGPGGTLNISTNDLQLTNGGQVRSGSVIDPFPAPDETPPIPSGQGGTINIQGLIGPATSVVIDGAGSGIFTNAVGTGAAGDTNITAQSVTIQNGGTISAATSGTATSATGGAITVDASQVQLLTGGLITAATTGPGNAGSVTITAADSVTIEGQVGYANPPLSATSRIITSTNGLGNGGDVTITAGQSVSITGNQSGIFTNTSSTGDAGNVNINADTLTLTSIAQVQANTLEGSEGHSGNIDVQVTQASLTGGSQIVTSTVGLGDAGSIRIRADQSITLIESAINSTSFAHFGTGAGNAGPIWLTAPTIALQTSGLASGSVGPGNAGNILLEGNTIATGIGSTITSETNGPGRGGDIIVRGLNGSGSRAGDVTISGGSFIQSQTSGEGPAGNIDVMTERMALTDGGVMITASGAGGNAGNMKIDAGESVQISSFSLLESDAFGTGNAGQITVITPTVTVSDGGFMSSSTSASGNAGTLTINATSVNLLNGGQLTSSTLNFFPDLPVPTGNAGNVTVYGQAGAGSRATSVLIDGAGSGIFTDTQGTGVGGNILVNANSVTLRNGGMLSAETSGPEATATGGNITVHADQIALQSGAVITTSTSGAGDGGTVSLNANESISLVNSSIASNSETDPGTPIAGNGGQLHLSAPSITLEQGSALLAQTTGAGHAGTIDLNTNHLSLADMSVVQTSTQGPSPAGSITVQGLGGSSTKAQTVSLASGGSLSSISNGNDEFEGGAAGNILVETQTLSLSGGSQITTSSNFSSGDAGTITINAGEEVQLSQGILASRSTSVVPDEFVNDVVIGNAGSIIVSAPTVTLTNHSLITTTTDSRYTGDPSKGNAGSVTVNATHLSLTEGSQLTSSSIIDDSGQSPVGNAGNVTVQGLPSPASSVLIDGAGSGVFTDTQGAGAGGNVFVSANSVTLQNDGSLSATTLGSAVSATGGTITVDTTNTVTMNSALITASSIGTADAGSINITSPNGFTMQSSTITTQAGQGAGGGNIKVTTAPSATVLLQDSLISASVADGHGGGGNISIDPQYVILQNSQILAQAAQGQGGAITITAGLFMPDANSIVNADSGSGLNGTVTIQSPNAPGSGQVQPLGKTPLQATSLLNQHCAALAGGEFSSFTVAGRESLPIEPGSWLASPLATLNAGMGLGVQAEGVRPVVRGEGLEGETAFLSLRQISPAGFLTQAFAVDWSTGCTS